MVPWTSIGTMVQYYSLTYGDSFFVYLNVAFYGVGLPISTIQRNVDIYYDTIYGSSLAFQWRFNISVLVMMICLLSLPFCGFYGIIANCAIIGCCTWVCHGSISTLAGMVKYRSGVLQQIGFALPAFYGIVFSLSLNLSSPHVSTKTSIIFFMSSVACLVPGLFAWVCLIALYLANSFLTPYTIANASRESSGEDGLVSERS